MSKLHFAPNTVSEATASAEEENFFGKINWVNGIAGRTEVFILRSETEGNKYTLSADLIDGLTIAITALTNRAKVWCLKDDKGEISQLAVYST